MPSQKKSAPVDDQSLAFKITPEILEDLGVNLYTSLSKVLVEFVANAHDAGAAVARLHLDIKELNKHSIAQLAQAKAAASSKKSGTDEADEEIPDVLLPDRFSIEIEDDGYGMGRSDLERKFLLIGRRRRKEAKPEDNKRKRVIMGRKGLGKLAGFGIAHRVEVISKREDETFASKITLDYDDIMKVSTTESVRVPYERIEAYKGFKKGHGTRVKLSRLVCGHFENLNADVVAEVADYFWMVAIADFKIEHQGKPIVPRQKEIFQSYPEDPKLPPDGLVSVTLGLRGLGKTAFSYRIHFTPKKKYLKEHERGLRIYAHNRLTSPPSLLSMSTSANGYQYTSYLHGVVVADFIDDQPRDYIATDRQSLKWDTPALEDLRAFLYQEMETALDKYSRQSGRRVSAQVVKDKFTKKVINSSRLPPHRKRNAIRIATTLAKFHPDGVQSAIYRKALPAIVRGLGHGDILASISELAKEEHPDFKAVIREISELARQEYDDFVQFVEGRLEGLEALRKICDAQDFKKSKNEKALQRLFEQSSWLIDPTFFQFLTADDPHNVVNRKLAEHLKVASFVEKGYDPTAAGEVTAFGDNKRPDLVFLLNNASLNRVTIVELKAPNVPLHVGHLQQLKDYMRRTREWLDSHHKGEHHKVEGYLIGSRAVAEDAKNERVKALNEEESQRADTQPWQVFDIHQVLARSKQVHAEMIQVAERAALRITQQQAVLAQEEADQAAADAASIADQKIKSDA